MSKYDDILAAIETRLAGITQAAGYRTDAGFAVRKNLEFETSELVFPSLAYHPGAVRDALDGETPPAQGEENHYLSLKIGGMIRDTERGEQAEALRQDILAALKTDPYLGGLSEGFEGAFTSLSKVVPAEETGGLAAEGFLGFAEVEVTIFYVTAYGEE